QTGAGESAPQRAVDALVVGLGLDKTLRCRMVTEHLSRELPQRFLILRVREIHPLASAQRPWHAQSEDRDDVALDLVGPASEGENERGTVLPLDATLKDRLGRVPFHRPCRAHHLEQQSVGLAEETGAEYLGRRRIGRVERACG